MVRPVIREGLAASGLCRRFGGGGRGRISAVVDLVVLMLNSPARAAPVPPDQRLCRQ